jgi:hypothetical protein
LRLQRRIAVDLDRPVEAEGFVWADVVEHLSVRFGLAVQVGQGFDFHSVQVLVLEAAEGTFPDSVLAWAFAPGADVAQLGSAGDERGEGVALERAAVEFLNGVKGR